MQRLFTTFPGGLPGMGLLLLRLAVGGALVVNGVASLASRDNSSLGIWALCLPSIASGLALVTGLLTPAVGVLAAALSLGSAAAPFVIGVEGMPVGGTAAVFLFVMAVALVLLGPGAFSLDARLFGRREIVVPRALRRSSPD